MRTLYMMVLMERPLGSHERPHARDSAGEACWEEAVAKVRDHVRDEGGHVCSRQGLIFDEESVAIHRDHGALEVFDLVLLPQLWVGRHRHEASTTTEDQHRVVVVSLERVE